MGLFLEKLMGAPEVKPLLSDEHFSVDGTLLQAWASHASLKRINGQEDPPPPPTGPGEGFGAPKEGKKRAKGDFRGIKLSNEAHRSSTDPVDAVFSAGVGDGSRPRRRPPENARRRQELRHQRVRG